MQKRHLLQLPLMKVTNRMREVAESDEGVEVERSWGRGGTFWVPNFFWFYRVRQHEEVLEIAMFTRCDILAEDDLPRYRVFLQRSGKYNTYDMGTSKWRQSTIENLEYTKNWNDRPDGLWYREGLWISEKEKCLVQDYTRKEGEEPRAAVQQWQTENRHRTEIDTVNSEMALVPAVPKDFENWMLKKGMPQYIFYTADRSVTEGYCSHCEKVVNVENPKYGTAGACKSCKSKITFISRKKGGRRIDERRLGLLQKTSKGYVYRQFKVVCWYEVGKLFDGGFKEEIRIVYDKGFSYIKTYMYTRFKNTGVVRWQYWRHLQGGPVEWTAKLYSRNLKAILKDSPLKYSALDLFAKNYQGLFFASGYIEEIQRKPWIERLVKCKFYNLAAGEITTSLGYSGRLSEAQSLKKMLGVNAEYYRLLAGTDPTDDELLVTRKASDMKIRLSRSDIEYLSYNGRSTIIDYFRHSTPHKFIRYLREVIKDNLDDVSLYGDYLSMAEKLGYDLRNSYVLFPRDLQERHDVAVEENIERERRIKEMHDSEKEKLWQQMRKRSVHLEMQSKGLAVVLPKKLEEIREEGHALRHCVSTYSDRVVKGETLILFVRKATEKDKPYFTLEVKDGKVSQCRGKNNKNAPKEVKDLLKHFEKKKLATANLRRTG